MKDERLNRMRSLVGALCDDLCAGRKTGTLGSARARGLLRESLRDAGLDPVEQDVPACGGVNLLATLPGDTDRYVLVAAHYDHLGAWRDTIYRGADDNAAAVAILCEAARALAATRPAGRGVLLAAFDAEEPPHFLSEAMGSQHFVQNSPVPLDHIDQMICMDLVGHAVGPEALPQAVRESVFVLGAERSLGTAAVVDGIDVPGVVTRRIDAEVIPPLSDYLAFWRAKIPFVFLTCGRWAHYHTPEDTPDKLDYSKMASTASWLEVFVRRSCARDDEVRFTDAPDDASTLESVISLCAALSDLSPQAELGRSHARDLLAACDAQGRLPLPRRSEAQALVALLENALA
jgi:hypothetical protein